MAEKLLLVDDEEGIRKVLALNLREAGYEVFTAADGATALYLFNKHHPAIVLTDIKMPGMDGLEILDRVKAIDADVEVVMITGHGDLKLAIESIKRQAADFVTKPINEDVLEIALSRAVERFRLRRTVRDYTTNLERLVEEKSRELLLAERFATVGRTAASLAHAIKNIAAGLEAGLYLIDCASQEGQSPLAEEGLKALKGNVNRVRQLALDLLRLGNEAAPRAEASDASEVAASIVELMTPRAVELGLELVLVQQSQSVRVLLDAESLHGCLLNLVTNALEACRDGAGGKIVLLVSAKEAWGLLSVEDDGPGLDPESAAHVFEGFISGKKEGFGLGLMSTRRVVEAVGGSIRLQSHPGGGCVFTLSVPLADGGGDRQAQAGRTCDEEGSHG